jgi:hypothetical protein
MLPARCMFSAAAMAGVAPKLEQSAAACNRLGLTALAAMCCCALDCVLQEGPSGDPVIRQLFGLKLHKSLKAEEGDETIEVCGPPLDSGGCSSRGCAALGCCIVVVQQPVPAALVQQGCLCTMQFG